MTSELTGRQNVVEVLRERLSTGGDDGGRGHGVDGERGAGGIDVTAVVPE